MADGQGSGKKGRKIGRNKVKCAHYKSLRKKFIASHEHRHCGPLGYFQRRMKMLDEIYGSPKAR
jgi:hypothetical protein